MLAILASVLGMSERFLLLSIAKEAVSLESFWKLEASANSQLVANLGDGCRKDGMIVLSRVNAQVIPVDSGFSNGYLS